MAPCFGLTERMFNQLKDKTMKKIMIAAMAMLLSTGAFAQSVIETVAQVGMLTVPAQQMSIDKDAKLAEGAMRARLKEAGLKVRNNEGWIAAVEQVFEQVSPSPISFFAKIETEGRKSNKMTVITICAVPTDLTQNQAVLSAALRAYLESFPQYIDRYQAQLDLEAQEGNLKKAEKAAEKATAAVASIDKDIAAMQAKIDAKRQEISKLQSEIADLEKKIEKAGGKKSEAQRKASDADQNVKAAQNEVDRYRQMAQ